MESLQHMRVAYDSAAAIVALSSAVDELLLPHCPSPRLSRPALGRCTIASRRATLNVITMGLSRRIDEKTTHFREETELSKRTDVDAGMPTASERAFRLRCNFKVPNLDSDSETWLTLTLIVNLICACTVTSQNHASSFPAVVIQSHVVYERQHVGERISRHIQRRCWRPDQLSVSLPSDRCGTNILSSKLSKLTGAKILSSDWIPSSRQVTTVPDQFHGAREVLVGTSFRQSSTGSMVTIIVKFAGFLVPLAMASPPSRRRSLK